MAFAVLGVPWAHLLLRRLPSGGVLLAAPVGLFLFHWLAWLGLLTGLAPNGTGYAWAVLGVFALATLGLSAVMRNDLARLMRRRRLWLTGVGVLLVVYAAGVALRLLNPEINGTEKPMDLVLLQGAVRSGAYPPADLWFGGADVNYYYLGFSMAAAMIHLSGAPVAVGYNLYLAVLIAMTSLGIGSAAYDLGALLRLPVAHRLPVAGLSALVGVAAGNLAVVRALASDEFRDRNGFWEGIGWNASRVIQREDDAGLTDFTINEFPSFSFILGDLHPHVLALPFGVLAISLSLHWLTDGWHARSRPDWRLWAAAALAGVVLGSLWGLNAWDAPTYLVLVIGGALAARALTPRAAGFGRVLAGLAVVIAASALAWLPFHLSNRPLTNELGLVDVRTEALDFIQVFGLLGFVALAALAALLWDNRPVGRLLVVTYPPAAALLVVVTGGEVIGAVALALALTGALMLRRRRELGIVALGWVIASAAGLLLLVEIFRVDDFFGPPYERMNTVFKIHYQVWPLLAVAFGPAVAVTLRRISLGGGAVWAGARVAFVLAVVSLTTVSLSYSVAAAFAKADASEVGGTLDGLALARTLEPEEFEAIRWLRANAPPNVLVVEAPGRAYTGDSRAAVWTGLPIAIGWKQHEELWRGADAGVADRHARTELIFTSTDATESLALLHAFGATHVVFGTVERQRYGDHVESYLRSFLTPVHTRGPTVIFAVPAAA